MISSGLLLLRSIRAGFGSNSDFLVDPSPRAAMLSRITGRPKAARVSAPSRVLRQDIIRRACLIQGLSVLAYDVDFFQEFDDFDPVSGPVRRTVDVVGLIRQKARIFRCL